MKAREIIAKFFANGIFDPSRIAREGKVSPGAVRQAADRLLSGAQKQKVLDKISGAHRQGKKSAEPNKQKLLELRERYARYSSEKIAGLYANGLWLLANKKFSEKGFKPGSPMPDKTYQILAGLGALELRVNALKGLLEPEQIIRINRVFEKKWVAESERREHAVRATENIGGARKAARTNFELGQDKGGRMRRRRRR